MLEKRDKWRGAEKEGERDRREEEEMARKRKYIWRDDEGMERWMEEETER